VKIRKKPWKYEGENQDFRRSYEKTPCSSVVSTRNYEGNREFVLPKIGNNSSCSGTTRKSCKSVISNRKNSVTSEEIQGKTPEELRILLKEERIVTNMQRRIRAEEKLREKMSNLQNS